MTRRRRPGRSSTQPAACDGTQCTPAEAGVAGVAGRLLSDWPGTARLILVLVVCAALTTAVVTIAPVDVEVGPVKLTHAPATVQQGPP